MPISPLQHFINVLSLYKSLVDRIALGADLPRPLRQSADKVRYGLEKLISQLQEGRGVDTFSEVGQ